MTVRKRLLTFGLVSILAFGTGLGVGKVFDPIREPTLNHPVHNNEGGH